MKTISVPCFPLANFLLIRHYFNFSHSPLCSLTMFQFVHNLLKMRCLERNSCMRRCYWWSGVAELCLIWDISVLLKERKPAWHFSGSHITLLFPMSLLCYQVMLPPSYTYSVWNSNAIFYILLALCSPPKSFTFSYPKLLLDPILSSSILTSSPFYFSFKPENMIMTFISLSLFKINN